MTFLREYIFTLCSLMVIFSAIFTAVPDGATKKTLKAVMGIITALALISPFFGREEDLLPFNINSGEELVNYDKAEQIERRTIRQLEIRLEEEIKEALGRDENVRVTLTREGIIERVEIENASENDKEILRKKFGIDETTIT